MRVDVIGVHESVAPVFPAAALADALASAPCEVRVVAADASLADVDALVTLAYEDRFAAALEWIHSIQSGVDRFPADELAAEGVVLTNSTGIHRESVGETTVGYMLAFARGLARFAADGRERRWERPDYGDLFTLRGETACVVGLGTLGRGIAERAAALGARVTGVKRRPEPVAHVEEVYASDALLDAVSGARFVALALPLTDETEDLVDGEVLAAMDDDAYLLNVARGRVVAEGALEAALDAGEIAGAALDVAREEPLPPSSPLWDRESVLVTPHVAGISASYHEDVAALVRENLDRLTAGEEPTNRVV